jgi:hypothetical protein
MPTVSTPRAPSRFRAAERALAALYAPLRAASEAYVRIAFDRPWDEARTAGRAPCKAECQA